MTSSTLNPTVLEPLFAPWQEPNAHRVRAEKFGDPAVVKQGRRASPIEVVNHDTHQKKMKGRRYAFR